MSVEIDFATNFFAPTFDYRFDVGLNLTAYYIDLVVVVELVIDSDNLETGVAVAVVFGHSNSCC